MKVRPYILAGGRSSRMGRDKAMLSLGGRTLLSRAVGKLRAVPSLRDAAGKVTITVVGERTELEGADRNIVDRYPGCGPLGGMEAALRDLEEIGNTADAKQPEWAFFVPVDMPFLPVGLIDELLLGWIDETGRGARVCYPVVDGRPQPLVSMVHKSLHRLVHEALTARQFKVTAVLQGAADSVASVNAEGIRYTHLASSMTPVSLEEAVFAVERWTVTEEQERLKRLWFFNVNNEEEFREAETFGLALGST